MSLFVSRVLVLYFFVQQTIQSFHIHGFHRWRSARCVFHSSPIHLENESMTLEEYNQEIKRIELEAEQEVWEEMLRGNSTVKVGEENAIEDYIDKDEEGDYISREEDDDNKPRKNRVRKTKAKDKREIKVKKKTIIIGDHPEDQLTYEQESYICQFKQPRWFRINGRRHEEIDILHSLQQLASKGGLLENILLDYHISTTVEYAFTKAKSVTPRSSSMRKKEIVKDEFIMDTEENSYIVCDPSFPIIPLERRIKARDPGIIYVKTAFSKSIADAFASKSLLDKFSKRESKYIVPLSMEDTEGLLQEQKEATFDTTIPTELQALHKYCYVMVNNTELYEPFMGQIVSVMPHGACEVRGFRGLGEKDERTFALTDCVYLASCHDKSFQKSRLKAFSDIRSPKFENHFENERKGKSHAGSDYLYEKHQEEEQERLKQARKKKQAP